MSAIDRTWRPVSRRERCPVCEEDHWCRLFDDGATECMRIKSETLCKSGGWMHRPHGRPDDWRERLAQIPARPPRPSVDPDLADRTYRALLDRLTLSDDHRAALYARGLDDAAIARHGYRSHPGARDAGARIAAEVAAEVGHPLAGAVPGFAREHGRLELAGGAGLLIPWRDAQGRHIGLQLRPDRPGKGRKYTWFSSGDREDAAGGLASIGQNGSAVHMAYPPRPVSTRRVAVTEGGLKGNISADRLGMIVACVAGGSTSGVLAALVALGGVEEVVLGFDADKVMKPSVARADAELARTLAAAGYHVLQLTWPADAGKGLDDILTTIPPTIPTMEPHPAVAVPATPCPDVAALRRDLAAAKAYASDLVQTFLNPALSHKEKMAAVALTSLTVAKAEAGEIEPDGRVVLSTSDISDDWRPKVETGEHLPPVNPRTGTTPRMARSTVKPMMEAFIASGRIKGEVRQVTRTRANGSPYPDWDFVIDPGPDLTALLNPWAQYRPEVPKTRKVREAKPAAPEPHACPHCAEVHPISLSCIGCGAILGELLAMPPMGEKISPIETGSPPRALVRNGRKNISHSSDPIPYAGERRELRADRTERQELAAQDLQERHATPPEPEDMPPLLLFPMIELDMSPDDDYGLDAPPLHDAQEMLAAADHGDVRARQDLESRLARNAAQRGRPTFPKTRRETATPAGVAGDDVWTWS